jgi:hypothetical protein
MALQDMWCSTLKSSFVDGSLLYMLDHRHGHWNDLGPVGRAVTYVSPGGLHAHWKQTSKGAAMSTGGVFGNGALLRIAHADDLAVQNATLFLAVAEASQLGGAGTTFLAKRDAGGNSFHLLEWSPTVFTAYVTSDLFHFAVDYPTLKTVVITMSHKGAIEAIFNGVSAGIQYNVNLPGTDDSPIDFMNTWGGGGGDPRSLFLAHAMWNRVLTTAEISNLLQGWDRQTAITKPKAHFVWPTPILDPSLDVRLDLDMTPVGGKVIDRSPYGNHGTINGGPVSDIGVFSNGLRCDGVKDYIDCGSNASLDISSDISVMMWIKNRSPAALGVLAMKVSGGITGWYLGLNSASRLQAYFYSGGATLGGGVGVPHWMPPDRWSHGGLVVKGTVGRLIVNGIEVVRGAVTMSDDAVAPLRLGSGVGGNYLEGTFDTPKIIASALSMEGFYKEYLKGARKPIYVDDFSDYPVSPVALGVTGKVGPLTIIATTAKVVMVGSQKWVEWVGDGGNYAGSWSDQAAYGTYHYSFRKHSFAATDIIGFIGNLNSGYATGQNGFALGVGTTGALSIFRITNGAWAATLMSSAAGLIVADTDYELMAIRGADNSFTLFIKGGSFTDYTLVTVTAGTNPAADATYTAGGFLFAYIHDGNRVSNLSKLLGSVRPDSAPWVLSTGTYGGEMVSGIPCKVQVTAGYSFIPKDLDFRRVEFYLSKADASTTDLMLGDEIGGAGAVSQQGYCFRFGADESIKLYRLPGGFEVGTTAAGVIAANTLYQYRIERTALGVWTLKAKGGAYADWTTLLGPLTDNTYTTFNYWNEDYDAGDKSSAPKFFTHAA